MTGYTPTAVGILLATALAVCVGAGLAWYAARHGDHPLSERFAQLMIVETLWPLVYLLQFLSPSDAVARALMPLKTLPAVLASVLWFLFVVEYTADSEWLPDWTGPVLVGEAVVYWLVWLVNPGGVVTAGIGVAEFQGLRLVYERLGTLAGLQFLFLYALLLLSTVLLARFYLQSRNLYRRQTGLILVSALVVIVGNAVYRSGYAPHPRLDITPLLFVVQGVGVFLALSRYDFLEVTPVAADTVLEEMSDPVFTVDSARRVVDSNEAAARYLPDEDRPPLSAVGIDGLASATDGGQTDGITTVTTLQSDETTETVTYDVRVTPIEDHRDAVRGHVYVLRDISDIVAREQALEHQNERLEKFAQVVSHDLRNPLSVVDGNVELAYQTGDVERLEPAREATDRMERLIEDLLSVARDGQLIESTEPVDLATVAEDAWRQVDTRSATLVVDIDMQVDADPSRLQEAFENLFRNAVEHGSTNPASHGQQDAVEHGPAGVTIEVGAFGSGFYVADDGPGIPEDEREDIFEMGYSSTEGGTGFGLAIVERVVEAHGWALSVTESEDGGARFEVTGLYSNVLEDSRDTAK